TARIDAGSLTSRRQWSTHNSVSGLRRRSRAPRGPGWRRACTAVARAPSNRDTRRLRMPFAASGGVQLYYEDSGAGTPAVFAHEFGADLRSWEPQVRFFSRRYRCVTYNARGYPPSGVPTELTAYSQAIAALDLAAVVTHLRLAPAHVVG